MFDTGSNRFTAPVAGTYLLGASVLFSLVAVTLMIRLTMVRTVVRVLTTALLVALFAGIAIKLRLFGHAP